VWTASFVRSAMSSLQPVAQRPHLTTAAAQPQQPPATSTLSVLHATTNIES
jgi:hypothetical protein